MNESTLFVRKLFLQMVYYWTCVLVDLGCLYIGKTSIHSLLNQPTQSLSWSFRTVFV